MLHYYHYKYVTVLSSSIFYITITIIFNMLITIIIKILHYYQYQYATLLLFLFLIFCVATEIIVIFLTQNSMYIIGSVPGSVRINLSKCIPSDNLLAQYTFTH